MFLKTFFACLKQFYFLTESEYFAWAIAFALRPFLAIIKMLPFFEYWLFFRAVFCTEHLKCVFRKVYRMFEAILFFDRK